MNIYTKLGVIVALLMYPPLAYKILKRRVEQNLAAFILWGLLDAVAALSLFVQGGNWFLPGAYVFGCITVVVSLLIVKTYEWTIFETFVSLLVLACIVGWAVSGPRMATIMSTTGVMLAGAPQLVDAIKKPAQQPILEYLGFTIANVLSTMGGKSWTVEERLYPGACVVLCGAVLIACSRKYFLKSQRVMA